MGSEPEPAKRKVSSPEESRNQLLSPFSQNADPARNTRSCNERNNNIVADKGENKEE
jgi:hypothetical protein